MADLFYIQRKGYIGNNLIWWRSGGKGYSSKLDEAWKVSEATAKEICAANPEEDIAWSCVVVWAAATRQVDSQDFPPRANA